MKVPVMSVCLSLSAQLFVHPPACIIAAPTGWIYVKFDIGYFYENLLRNSKCGQNQAKVSGTLHEYLSSFCCCW